MSGKPASTPLRFEIRVKPGDKSTSVGGTHGDGGPLNVMVKENAKDGEANEAALELLATVLKVRKRQLRILSGHTHRTKLVEVSEPTVTTLQRLDHWRAR